MVERVLAEVPVRALGAREQQLAPLERGQRFARARLQRRQRGVPEHMRRHRCLLQRALVRRRELSRRACNTPVSVRGTPGGRSVGSNRQRSPSISDAPRSTNILISSSM